MSPRRPSINKLKFPSLSTGSGQKKFPSVGSPRSGDAASSRSKSQPTLALSPPDILAAQSHLIRVKSKQGTTVLHRADISSIEEALLVICGHFHLEPEEHYLEGRLRHSKQAIILPQKVMCQCWCKLGQLDTFAFFTQSWWTCFL